MDTSLELQRKTLRKAIEGAHILEVSGAKAQAIGSSSAIFLNESAKMGRLRGTLPRSGSGRLYGTSQVCVCVPQAGGRSNSLAAGKRTRVYSSMNPTHPRHIGSAETIAPNLASSAEAVRALFEIPDDVTYLNCANMAPQLRSVTRAGMDAVKKKSGPWNLTAPEWFSGAEQLRTVWKL